VSTRERRTRKPTRRNFLAGAGFIGAGVAMPQVSRAQTIIWKYQSTWPMKDIFHDGLIYLCSEMTLWLPNYLSARYATKH
jgi:hypothetical protein